MRRIYSSKVKLRGFKLTDISRISIISTAETALKKLKNANIGVYNCKKEGARFIFSIKDKDLKKVFAIFSKPCYNISVRSSRRKNILSCAVARIGLIVGTLVFVCIAVIANSFIFKIEVSGSGSYLYADVKSIIYEQGFSEFKSYRKLNVAQAEGKILSLPSVTFCNIEKHGSILKIDVQVEEEHDSFASRQPLISDTDGVIKKLVTICGTSAVAEGSAVKSGDTLIYAYTLVGEQKADCLAVGFAEIECKGAYEYSAPEDTADALKGAYSKANLYAENIINRTHTVKNTEDGIIYLIEFTYLHKISINME